ncbi:MAG: nuclease [Candidatus Moranbacteria bacterium CG_4_9_14_3_um_filter_40_7]|uniref:Nuclease n=1 Tax=Candidatus Nealsonbacteria bacterium CG23_combo_of_CG06-09_8_20_14_all_37_18 TaxID=1974720 RepID=A0A2G9YYY8_9BACT|nr:MAG: nuclease [Candidatus Nealsonbacteria bacterium CG23_combo_of_CG06-09_8_20_14_all_37_18]PIU80567.1 MAG: nuclease [Candidatus Moranbacteria bacterium CG06_land_8_20_14_3_00_40_12]PJA87485.1 MAG: nuclease [Candidatus Moranbacteria bacterium CG_4_9_14_3_um_filter_40_7]
MTPKAKKIHIILAGVLILFIGVGIGFWMGKVKYSIPIGRQAENKNSNAISETGKSETKDGGEGDFVGEYKVSRVIDGDTIEIEGGERVRYIGIDTPETVDPRKPVQCFGVEASNKNKEMVVGKTVRLEKDTTDRDKYKRLLRYVYVGDTFINLEMVKQGFAYSYSYPPDIKFQKEILAAQQEAEKNKNGLWNACPLDAGRSATVSKEETIKNETSGACDIKGNISTSNEKIYHLPGCGSYAKTTIDESRGEKMFCTEAEAQAAGWRKALNCP